MNTDAEILLAHMRVAVLRLKLVQAEIDEVAVTLKAGRISPAGAVAWLRENEVADLVLPVTISGREIAA